ncbi:MAG: hypothetical protein WBG92_07575 [Thiohalocapsa sp.]
MKASMLSVGVVLLTAMPVSYAGTVSDRTADPCFHVSIQNQQVNRSNVRQNCDRNVNRTVQAGAQNSAATMQTGNINDNKVRQYDYDVSKYFDRKRRN